MPAFGSHNVRSVAHALATADRLGLRDSGYEIQMLYGFQIVTGCGVAWELNWPTTMSRRPLPYRSPTAQLT